MYARKDFWKVHSEWILEVGNIYKEDEIAQQKHSQDGKKRGGADAASLDWPLVMQVVRV